jgi:hypothetical protein
VRLPRVVASATLIVALALVVLPSSVGSRTPSPALALDPSLLQPIEARAVSARTTATTLDAAWRSDAALDTGDPLLDPIGRLDVPPRAIVAAPVAPTRVIVIPTWRLDPEISWYGPGFYGNGTACGQRYTETIMGVAHRSLPCGTLVSFKHRGVEITVPVIDRGPYVGGRIFDLSRAACKALNHCYTGPIYYKFP